MFISNEDRQFIIKELTSELHAKPDGGGKNLIVSVCPYCGHGGGKFGIYIGPETAKKKLFMTHCFHCGHTTIDLNKFLDDINRPDLKLIQTADFSPLKIQQFVNLDDDNEIDDELLEIDMPDGWKRCYKNEYLKSRGFTFDDYEYFPVGTTRGLNFKFDNYVIFKIIDNTLTVGYVGRHTWSKDDIDAYNIKAKRNQRYEIRRYNNSTDNDFVKLLYNYDAIIENETDTVIIVEGVFDVIALTRKLELYDNHRVVVVATFGKKISDIQIYKLQLKGVKTVVIGYDGDACESINKAADKLNEYFDVLIAYIKDPENDFDSMDFWEIFDTFTLNLKTPVEYKLNTVQL